MVFNIVCIVALLAIVTGSMMFMLAGRLESVIWSLIFAHVKKVSAGDEREIVRHEERLKQAFQWRVVKYASVLVACLGFIALCVSFSVTYAGH